MMRTISQIIESPSFPKLVGTMPIGMCLIGSDLEYIELNSAWAEMLGYTPQELRKMPFSQTTYPGDRHKDGELSCLLLGVASEAVTINKRWVRKDGSLLRGVMTVSVLAEPGLEHCGFVTVVPDRNQVFDTLRNEKVVHDLRSLLHAIQLAADCIDESPENKVLSDAISNSVTLADSVATSLLDVGRIAQENCSVRRVLENCVSIVSATLPVNVKMRCRCLGQPTVAINETKLSEVVLNLLTNARAATRDGGDIEVHCEEQNGFIAIHVSDDGVGMSEAEIQSATRDFYTTKRDLVAGLGLSIVGSIIASVSGHMEITSTKDVGSTVVCKIPLSTVS